MGIFAFCKQKKDRIPDHTCDTSYSYKLYQQGPHRYKAMSTEEISNGSSNVEGETDQENDKIGCDKLPLVPSLSKLGRLTTDFNFDVDNWMKQYVQWTDERPMFSRCVVSALTASIGVLLARATTRKARSHQRQQAQYGDIGILEIIAFAVHGGFVGGPLSYYM